MDENILRQVKDSAMRNSSDTIVVTNAFIVPTLKTDLTSVKSLNRQGYRVINDEDPEESGIFPELNGKIDKSKSLH
jgi:hypothetical protein